MDIKRTITRKNLKIIKVTQHSEMKQIIGWGAPGKRRPRFQGAIVAENDAHGTRYVGVPEGRFMRNDPCYAKHGSHDSAKWLLVTRKTGVVDKMVIIAWESKPSKWVLVHESRILDFSLVQQNSRSTAWPDRFEPGASDMVRKATPVLSKGVFQTFVIDIRVVREDLSFHVCGYSVVGFSEAVDNLASNFPVKHFSINCHYNIRIRGVLYRPLLFLHPGFDLHWFNSTRPPQRMRSLALD